MPSKSISFRSQLLSNAHDTLAELGIECARTAKLIAGIVSSLAAYTEEGVVLTPTVFICNSIQSLLQRAGTGEHIVLSGKEPTDAVAAKILKAAAPLCRGNWRIYVERSGNGETCQFGVFCGSSDPTSLTVDEVVLETFEADFPIIRIAQNAVNRVEVRTNFGNGIEFRFNDDLDVNILDGTAQLRALAKAIARDVPSLKDQFASFVERMLSEAIRECHGTLIAVIPLDSDIPDPLADAVAIDPPLDLFERFRVHGEEGKTSDSVSRIQTASELVGGFIQSDGITIFSSAGSVVCFRAFIKNDASAPPSVGGARSRAYTAMKQLLGTELRVAFFRSQDGRMDVSPADEGAND